MQMYLSSVPCPNFLREHAYSMQSGLIIGNIVLTVSFSNIIVGYALMVLSNSTALTIGKLTLPLSTGVPWLKSRQVDYTQAFPQAPLDDEVFMRIPQGWFFDPKSQQLCPNTSNASFHDTQHCIQLKCNLYGIKQAAQNRYLHLKQGLINHGFIQSNINPCLFIWNDCILVVYTNDCCMFA